MTFDEEMKAAACEETGEWESECEDGKFVRDRFVPNSDREQDFEAGARWALDSQLVRRAFEILSDKRACQYDIIQKQEDGVWLQGTKHSETCEVCELRAAYDLAKAGGAG